MIERAKAGSTPGRVQAKKDADRVKRAVAKLYASGMDRRKVAKKCQKWLITPEMRTRPADQRQKHALQKLKRWELQDSFRDMVWSYSVAKLDIQSTAILDGVARQAKAGRVDAARLALEVTGRHNPKGDGQPTAVVIQVNGVPRPQVTAPDPDEIVEADLVREEDG